MKHAYLIIAHNEFEVLRKLVEALDHERNDIFIHWDKKTKNYPEIKTVKSKLFLVKNRIDVRWGNVSQIKAELQIFKEAYNTFEYDYFHLISGIHFPLKSMNQIFDYFDSLKGKSLLIPMEYSEYEVTLKIRRYNFFTKYFKKKYFKSIVQFAWKSLIFVQKELKIKRNNSINYIKASNWMSINKKHIGIILNNEKTIIKQYKYSFCGDEFFIPSLLLNNNCLEEVVFNEDYLKCEFLRANPKVFTIKDYDELITSNAFFARKFSEENLDVLLRLLERIKNEKVY